jgi:hypothetical protein
MKRFSVTIPLVVFLALAAWTIAWPGPAAAGITRSSPGTTGQAVQAALDWLVSTHQNDDGGFTGFSQGANQGDSDVGGTVDALLAVASAGGELQPLLDYLAGPDADLIAFAQQDGGSAGKLVWALVLAGEDPGSFGGHDLVTELEGHLGADGGLGADAPYSQALAIIGLSAAGADAPPEALGWLIERQATEAGLAGSWDDGYGTAGNPDATAVAALALHLGGSAPEAEPVTSAVAFLDTVQLPTGGWEYGPGFGENANSTALVILALATIGEDVRSERWMAGAVSPLDALLGWQSDSGAFQADFGQGRSDDFFTTVQAVPALAAVADTAEESAQVATAAGGDSILPYIVIGLVIVLLAVTVVWLRRGT